MTGKLSFKQGDPQFIPLGTYQGYPPTLGYNELVRAL